MTLAMLGGVYLGVGVVAAFALVATRRLTAADGTLVVVLWPIWIPLSLARGDGPDAPAIEARIRELTGHAEEVATLRRLALARLHADAARLRGELAEVERKIMEYDLSEAR